jgi:hypothetical protein
MAISTKGIVITLSYAGSKNNLQIILTIHYFSSSRQAHFLCMPFKACCPSKDLLKKFNLQSFLSMFLLTPTPPAAAAIYQTECRYYTRMVVLLTTFYDLCKTVRNDNETFFKKAV